MKNVMAIMLFLVFGLSFSAVACGRNATEGISGLSADNSCGFSSGAISSAEGESDTCDESDIFEEEDLTSVLSKILVVSDVHVNCEDENTENHLANTLLYAKNYGIDAIIFDGDTPNIGREQDYAALDRVFTSVYGAPKSNGLPQLIFNAGNHEFYPTGNCAHEETDYQRELNKFKAFAEKWGDAIEDNVFVRDVNGIKCVLAFPSADRTYIQSTDNKYAKAGDVVYLAAGGGYSENDVKKVKRKFDEILAGGYDKTIVFCTHHPLGETYGSTLYGMDTSAESQFRNMLKNYPMIVHVSGHTHFSSLHERSFVQNEWTSVQIGMHTYGKYVTGVDKDENGKIISYDNITGKQYNALDQIAKSYHGSTNFGMLLTFTEKKMIAERVYLSTGEIYSHGQWLVPYGITADNYHRKFYYEEGERVGEDMSFGNDMRINSTVVDGKLTNVSFCDVENYWACEGYEIVIIDAAGLQVRRIMWASHFWMGLGEKQVYTIPVNQIKSITVQEGYKIRIRAIDFFGHYGKPCESPIAL